MTTPGLSRLSTVISDLDTHEADTSNPHTVTAAQLGLTGPMDWKGAISAAADFPTSAAVSAGDSYRIAAAVVDNDATKTNTGQQFLPGEDIAWNGTAWIPLGQHETVTAVAATPHAVAAGDEVLLVDTAGIGAGVTVNLPALAATRARRRLKIIDSGGSANTYNIAVTPDGTDQINGVAAAINISDNYGSLELIADESGAEWYTTDNYGDLVAHEAVTDSQHGKIQGQNAAIDMVSGAAPANNVVTLNGTAAQQFVPKEIIFECTAGVALNGDVTVSVGTTPGGAELLPATQLTGLNAANEVFRIIMAGVMPNILGNAALDITVTIDDTGTSGTMTGTIIGTVAP